MLSKINVCFTLLEKLINQPPPSLSIKFYLKKQSIAGPQSNSSF